jgi:ribosomal protein L3
MSIFQEFLNEAKYLLKQATIEANTNEPAPDSQTDTLPESPNAVTPVKEPEPETKTKKSKKNKVKIVPKVVEETKIDVENGDNDKNDEDMILTADDVATGSPDIKNASNLKDAYVLNAMSPAAPQPNPNNPIHYMMLAAAANSARRKKEEKEKEKELKNSNAVSNVKSAKKIKLPNRLKESGILDSIGESLGKGVVGKGMKWIGEHPIKTFLGGAALGTVATTGIHALRGRRGVSSIDPNTQYYGSLGWANNPGLSSPFGGSKLASELLNNKYFLAGLLDALNK